MDEAEHMFGYSTCNRYLRANRFLLHVLARCVAPHTQRICIDPSLRLNDMTWRFAIFGGNGLTSGLLPSLNRGEDTRNLNEESRGDERS